MSREPVRKLAPNPEMTESDLDFIIKIAKRDAALIRQMKAAYLKAETAQVLDLVRELCGIPEDQKQIQ